MRAIATESVVSSKELRDAAILISVFAIGAVCCWEFRLPWVVANFVMLGLPLMYLLLVSKKARTKIRPKFTILFIVFATVVFDYLCERYAGWTGPTLFPFKLPGGVTVEEIQWLAFFFPLTFAINEHFFATQVRTPPNPTAKLILKSSFYIGLFTVLPLTLLVERFSYVYVCIGLILQPTFILFGIWVNKWILREVLLIGITTGLLNIIFEIIALRNNYWEFSGTYVGYVQLLGFQFPVEELVFLILLSGPSIVSTYAIYKNYKQI